MDALVLQVAQEMQATLVTLDNELLKSVRGLIPAKSIEALVR